MFGARWYFHKRVSRILFTGGVCSRRGCLVRGGLLWGGACSQGVCSRGCAWSREVPALGGAWWRSPHGYYCGRYASYWNAFLFIYLFIYLCFQNYFLIDNHCRRQNVFSDLLQIIRIFWTLLGVYTVMLPWNDPSIPQLLLTILGRFLCVRYNQRYGVPAVNDQDSEAGGKIDNQTRLVSNSEVDTI